MSKRKVGGTQRNRHFGDSMANRVHYIFKRGDICFLIYQPRQSSTVLLNRRVVVAAVAHSNVSIDCIARLLVSIS